MALDDLVDELLDREPECDGGCGKLELIVRLVKALDYIAGEAAAERRGLRMAEPTPVHGVDAGLTMIELAANRALRRETPLEAGLR